MPCRGRRVGVCLDPRTAALLADMRKAMRRPMSHIVSDAVELYYWLWRHDMVHKAWSLVTPRRGRRRAAVAEE